ncbi:restriction endonuclease subunit S [Streptococcus pseudopneumoniae]|uniref:Restriction endonuclease subunit S n=2 Tax=Streptococcus pseudopneumoniae TaxID=257758 RepID=A0AAW4C8C6_9STRE|nr:restriction endonuclease subunit S [Streptococcus pseudopneumoniae]MBF9674099.1 restriction endonuclease subunit S [Streptococcus pseudopneumoniae]
MTPEQLKASILQRAMEGKLVPQNPNDEPASELLKRIKAEKEKLISEGKIKRDKKETEIFRGDDGKHYGKFADGSTQEIDVPYDIPDTWEWVRVGNICTTNIGLTFKPSEVQETGIPIYKANNIKNGKISTLDLSFVSEKTIIKENEWLNKNDILMAVRSGSKQLVGKTAIVGNLKMKTSFGAFMSVIRPISVSSTFMNYFFQSSHFRSQLDDANTTTIFQVTQKMLKETLLPLPPLAEQKRIVAQIERALKKVEIYAESYNQLQKLDKEFPDKLKKSILQYAMQGKLVEQDPNDEPVEVLLEKIRAEKQKLFEEGKIKKKDLEISIVSQGDDNSYYGKIPMNWVQTTLNYIGIISTGNTPSKNSPENYGGEIPFYKPADLLQGELYNATEYLSVLGNTKSRKIKAGSILINGIGNIGIAGIVRVDGAFNQQMHGIEVFNFVNSKFLLLAIQSDFMQKQFKNNTSSTTIPILNKTRFSQTIINFPGIRTQKLIITKAEKLFEKVSQF